jgi:hypothetical protein
MQTHAYYMQIPLLKKKKLKKLNEKACVFMSVFTFDITFTLLIVIVKFFNFRIKNRFFRTD